MNSKEREIFDKFAYDKVNQYVLLVYLEFERRVNNTTQEFRGLKRGECELSISILSTKFNLSTKKVRQALKKLEDDNFIKRRTVGTNKGAGSIYYLTRFDDTNSTNKGTVEDTTKNANEGTVEASNSNGSSDIKGIVKSSNSNDLNDKKGIVKGTAEASNSNGSSDIKGTVKGNISKYNIIYSEVISYLNLKTGKNFRTNAKDTIKYINARLDDGYSVEDFKRVIDNKTSEWINDNKFSKYLRPSTLFSAKFDEYLNECAKVTQEEIDYNSYIQG